MKTLFALILALVSCLPVDAQRAADAQQKARGGAVGLRAFPPKGDIQEKEAIISKLKQLANGGIRMTTDGADEVILIPKTMIYMLTRDNTEAFAKKDVDERLKEVYDSGIVPFQSLVWVRDDVLDRLRRREGLALDHQAQLKYRLEAEDERHHTFGPVVKLTKGMKVYLYSDKNGVAWAVLAKFQQKDGKGK